MYKGEKQGRWITGAANLEFNDGFLGKIFFFFLEGGVVLHSFIIYMQICFMYNTWFCQVILSRYLLVIFPKMDSGKLDNCARPDYPNEGLHY